jgi:methylated-DNA-[protein]-cysteine S-methyltransferase
VTDAARLPMPRLPMPRLTILRLTLASPLGPLTIFEEDGALVKLGWHGDGGAAPGATPLLIEARRQLNAYFAGTLRDFTLPLRAEGSAFQRQVWDAMLAIPYGETLRYGDVARAIGGEPRAVGSACGANPIAILIPCHRIVGAAGLTGYSGGSGIDTKQRLLDLERGQTRLF